MKDYHENGNTEVEVLFEELGAINCTTGTVYIGGSDFNSESHKEGVILIICGIIQTCAVCMEGKPARLSFLKYSENSFTAPINLLHSKDRSCSTRIR